MAYFRCIGKSTPKYKKYLGQLIERVNGESPKITSSYNENNHKNWSAFNGISPTNMREPNSNTCWIGQQNVYDDWIQYEFNRLYWFNKIKIKCFSNYSGDWVGNIKILGSQDGINWENILSSGNNYELTAEYQSITTFDINLKDDKEYQYIRLQADNVSFSVFGYPSCFFDEIYVYGGVIASSELEDILTGVNNPSSDLGVNGQVYLKYADYNNLYDFKEYIEVGSTQGAYINTGLKFTTNSEFEIDCQWTATPTNTNGYAFGAWTSNQDTFVGFQNGNKFNYAVGGVHNDTTSDFQRHVFKATQTKMYIDNVEQSGTPKWSFVSTAPIGIFIISNNTSYLTNNCKIYYIKIWDNTNLVHYFIPVERKSDNEAGMLDIITGIFYDNDGTQSFTVGGTQSVTFDYPITQTYAKINSTWQNLIGTDVRKIISGQNFHNIISIIGKEFPYKDASPVNYEQVIDGKIFGHLDMTNEGRQGTYMLPAKTGYNKLSLYIKESQDGQETQVNINDYTLVTTGSSEGNYFYHLYYSNPNYIYSIRFEYTGIYRVSGTLTVDIIID